MAKKKRSEGNKLGEMEVSCGEPADKKTSKRASKKMSPIVADIDRRAKMPVKEGGLNLFYAIDGYEWSTGRAIMDYQKLIDTLITYGYDIRSVLDYLDIMSKRKSGPIVSQTKDMSYMYGEVDRIPEVEELVKKFKES